jgi:DNA-binding PadR family transcriptional regulator
VSLPHVLLGLLSDEPKTGYDLARIVRDEMDPFWRAEFSQIYPALARLRRAGFVVLRVLGPRRGPPRNLYRATAAGRRELRRWLAEPFPPPRGKEEGLARVALLDAVAPSERRAMLAGYEKTIAEEIRRLRAAPRPSGYRGEARRGALERLESLRRWMRGLAPETPGPEGGREARRSTGSART